MWTALISHSPYYSFLIVSFKNLILFKLGEDFNGLDRTHSRQCPVQVSYGFNSLHFMRNKLLE